MPERTDTVEYTADELAEARRVVEQMVNVRRTIRVTLDPDTLAALMPDDDDA